MSPDPHPAARIRPDAQARSSPRPRPAWAEIDLEAVRGNVRALRALLSPRTRFMAVVKADGYGHGAVEVARAALDAGAQHLGVATVDEGVQLRRAGIDAPVLILGATFAEDAVRAAESGLAVTVCQPDVARALGRAAGRTGRPVRVHLKVDTGMGRIGVAPSEAAAAAREIAACEGVDLEGCFTHFATADEADLTAARGQLEAFGAALREIEQAGVRIRIRHAANSAAALALPESHLDLVRVGIAMYSVPPAPHLAGRVRLRPVMRLCARVVYVKRVAAGTPIGYGQTYRAPRATTIATIPLGYADGYPRLAGAEGRVVIRGRRFPIAGRVSMDQLTVDAGDGPVEVGDEVEVWGPALPVDDVAAHARTISYEVLVGLGRRIPRVYVEPNREG